MTGNPHVPLLSTRVLVADEQTESYRGASELDLTLRSQLKLDSAPHSLHSLATSTTQDECRSPLHIQNFHRIDITTRRQSNSYAT